MANRNDIFPSKYPKASDLNGTAIVVTIQSAPTEVLRTPDGKEESKTVLGRQEGAAVEYDELGRSC
jgi:hypothetical protein